MILRLGALLLIVIAGSIALDALLPSASGHKFKMMFLCEEQKSLYGGCESARQSLIKQGVSPTYSKVEFRVRDERLQKEKALQDLEKCFTISENAADSLEVEVFSSDYENEISPDLQIQISAFDNQSRNKIAEAGFRMDLVPAKTNQKP